MIVGPRLDVRDASNTRIVSVVVVHVVEELARQHYAVRGREWELGVGGRRWECGRWRQEAAGRRR